MPESAARIRYEELGSYKPLFLDYLSRYNRLREFFAANPREKEAWEATAQRVSQKERDRARLAAELRRQNREMGADDAALAAIDALDQGALAIVTGQQVGLFGGPLYTLYKALTAVELARRMTDTLRRPVVSLFWMDADDHDFDEVRRARAIDVDHGVRVLSYSSHHHAPESPMASLELEPAIEALIRELDEILPATEFKADVLATLARCYAPGVRLADAFGRFFLRLTRGSGLVMVNPSTPELKAMAAPLFEREMRERSLSGRPVDEATAKLLEIGYHAQASTDSDVLNLFYASPGRHRIGSLNGSYSIGPTGRALSADEISRLIAAEPERFSPNVLLRPLFQDTVLPTLAYVAGPNELAYFAQLLGVYRHFDVPMPIIFPRASFTLVEPPHARFLKRYDVKLQELRANDEAVLNRILKHQAPPELERDFERARTCNEEILQALARDLARVDQTLVATARTTQGKVMHLISELEEKTLRAAKRKDETLRRQFLAARTALFPEFELQERVLSPVQFLAKYGWDLVDLVRRHVDLDAREHVVVFL